MNWQLIIYNLLTLLFFASAEPRLRRRSDPNYVGLYWCEDVDWQGKCGFEFHPWGGGDEKCYDAPPGISALGPDSGLSCIFYKIGGCRDFIGGQTLTVKSPGMSWVGEEWNDKIVSYQCFHE